MLLRDDVPVVALFDAATGLQFETSAQGGISKQTVDGVGEGSGFVLEDEVVSGLDIESIDARAGADDSFAHGHGFEHLDVGSGRGNEGRNDHGSLFVGGSHIADEAFEQETGLL